MTKEIFDLYIKVKVVRVQRHLKSQVVEAMWKNLFLVRKLAVQQLVHAVTTIHMGGEKPGRGFV